MALQLVIKECLIRRIFFFLNIRTVENILKPINSIYCQTTRGFALFLMSGLHGVLCLHHIYFNLPVFSNRKLPILKFMLRSVMSYSIMHSQSTEMYFPLGKNS